MKLSQLEVLLKQAWSRETSSDPARWTPENPAWGQCAVTALVVHDYFGGRLLWALARLPDGREISHYFNETEDKQIIDATKCQFPEETVIPEGQDKRRDFPTTHEYVLSYPATSERYRILKENIARVTKSTRA